MVLSCCLFCKANVIDKEAFSDCIYIGIDVFQQTLGFPLFIGINNQMFKCRQSVSCYMPSYGFEGYIKATICSLNCLLLILELARSGSVRQFSACNEFHFVCVTCEKSEGFYTLQGKIKL